MSVDALMHVESEKNILMQIIEFKYINLLSYEH